MKIVFLLCAQVPMKNRPSTKPDSDMVTLEELLVGMPAAVAETNSRVNQTFPIRYGLGCQPLAFSSA